MTAPASSLQPTDIERQCHLGAQALARWLPKREAVWWGCLCAWDAARPNPPPKEDAALRAVLRWIHEPTEANRRPLQTVSDAAGGTGSPAGCLALAAFFSAGSLTLPGLPVVPPPVEATAAAVAGAIMLTAAR